MERYVKTIPILGLALALGLAHSAHSDISWNGFLSTGGGFSDPEDGFTSVRGYEEDLTFHNETVLGLQVRAPATDKISATGQIVARGSDDYAAEVAWAYVSYEATDSTTLRLGRFRTPFYLYSDFLEVGYAYHWIAPPNDVYALPADSIDGIDVVYQKTFGSIDTNIQIYSGSINSDFEEGDVLIETKIRNQTGLAVTLNRDWLTLRMSHHEAQKVSFAGLENVFLAESIGTINDLANTLNQLSVGTGNNGYAQAASNLGINEVKFTFDEIALKVEWQNLLAVTEFTQLKPDSGPFDQQNRMFATLGYTVGPLMFHVTHAKSEDDIANISSTIPLNIPTRELTSAQLAGAVDALATNLANPSRTTNTIGVRWDFDIGTAFKAEYTEVEEDSDGSGTLLRFAIDMVF